MDWGRIDMWKEKYDTAIGNLLSGETPEYALTEL
jgi:hypothetical protein